MDTNITNNTTAPRGATVWVLTSEDLTGEGTEIQLFSSLPDAVRTLQVYADDYGLSVNDADVSGTSILLTCADWIGTIDSMAVR